MKAKYLPIVFILLFAGSSLFSQKITISGNVKLANEKEHDSINIALTRIVPSEYTITLITDNFGNYSGEIEKGIYHIKFFKEGLLSWEIDEQALYNNIVLSDVILKPYLSFIRVPEDISTIQAAINSAQTGDTVLISPGTYYENINFQGKDIVVASRFLISSNSEDIANTIIDGQKKSNVVKFVNGESANAKLIGLSITNGFANGEFGTYETDGGGIVCWGSSPTLSYLKVFNNSSQDDNGSAGGGISFQNCNATLYYSDVYSNNGADYHGAGGIHLYSSNVVIKNTQIYENTASSHGTGISLESSSNLTITNSVIRNQRGVGSSVVVIYIDWSSTMKAQNCIIRNNNYGAVQCKSRGSLILENSIIYNNGKNSTEPVIECNNSGNLTAVNTVFFNNYGGLILNRASSPGEINISNCLFYNNNGVNFTNCNKFLAVLTDVNVSGDSIDPFGNLFIEPEFVDEAGFDFTLKPTSPCIDAGIANDIQEDFYGNYRIWDGNADGVPVIDIGPYEYGSSLPLKISYVKKNVSGSDSLDGYIDITVSGGVLPYTFLWSTGDTTEDLSNIGEGLYSVIVTDADSMTDSLNIEIEVPDSISNSISLSGRVFAKRGLLTDGTVLLFKKTESYIMPVDYTKVNVNGVYEFKDLNQGAYLLYAIPNPYVQQYYAPTYYVNKLSWEVADYIELIGNGYNFDIQLREMIELEEGEGSISGQVVYEHKDDYEETIYHNSWFQESGQNTAIVDIDNPAANISVNLYTDAGELVRNTISSESGSYMFDNLPYGNYYIEGQKAGKVVVQNAKIILDETNQSEEGLFIVIENNKISSVRKNAELSTTIQAYPMPASDEFFIDVEAFGQQELVLTVFNLSGKVIDQLEVNKVEGITKLRVNIGHLSDGLYYGQITSANKSAQFKILIKR